MKRLPLLASLLVLAAPLAAPAQSIEKHYCNELADKYAGVASTAIDRVALDTATAKCEAGDTKAGIAILEQALKDTPPLSSRPRNGVSG